MNLAEAQIAAYNRNQTIDNRTERAMLDAELFVEIVDTSDLVENGNRLIFGRRGTGKTIVFNTSLKELQAQFRKSGNVYGFGYDLRTMLASPEFSQIVPTPRDRGHAYFQVFLEVLADDVVDMVEMILADRKQRDRFDVDPNIASVRHNKLLQSAVDLIDAARLNTSSVLPELLKSTLENHPSAQQEAEYFNIVPVSNGASEARGGHPQTSSRAVRDAIVRVVESLGLRHVVIYLDEWMALGDGQVEFASLIKTVFVAEPRISFKIAADRYQCVFNNAAAGSRFRGLELDADIFEAFDLDRPYAEPAEREKLFAEVLYRRLLYCQPELLRYFGDADTFDAEDFTNHVFETRQAFRELCQASHGICRDFHDLFQDASKLAAREQRATVSIYDVRTATELKTKSTFNRLLGAIDSNALVFEVIRPHIIKTQSRFFAVASTFGTHTQVIRDLLSKRIIHKIDAELLNEPLAGRYDVFEIDFGYFKRSMKAMAYATEVSEDYEQLEVRDIDMTSIDRYLLDSELIENLLRREFTNILCDSCHVVFSSDAKAFKVRGICPHCYSDVEGK